MTRIMRIFFVLVAISIFSLILSGCLPKYQVEKYPSGNIKSWSYVIYANGNPIKHGRYFELFENGDTSLTGFYKQDKKDSTWREYSLSHEEVRRSIYQNDSLLNQYEGYDLSLIIKGYQQINSKVLYVGDRFYLSMVGQKRNTRSDGIENLKAYKSIESGKIIITFNYKDTWPRNLLLIPSYYMVTLLDGNDQELDHWRSQEVYIPEGKYKKLLANYLFMPYDTKLDSLKEQKNFLSYNENQKNLQFLETVKFGISGLEYNPTARLPYGGAFSF